MTSEHIWRPLRRPQFGLLDAISDVISMEEWRNPDLLTSVRLGPGLVITSDYGGDHRASQYESLSFLVADLAFCWLWDELRLGVRRQLIGDSRTVSYKKLSSDIRRSRALVPFLRAANTIPGLLITILFHKEVVSWFSEPLPQGRPAFQTNQLGPWKKQAFASLTRVGHVAAMLVACMSAPGQDVIWFTDRDRIAPNADKLKEATRIMAHLLSHYLPHSMGHFRFGTTDCDNGSMEIEDLVALPDLASGALSEVMTRVSADRGRLGPQVYIPLPDASKKARAICGWLADGGHPLKKALICVDPSEPGTYSVKFVTQLLESPMTEYDW